MTTGTIDRSEAFLARFRDKYGDWAGRPQGFPPDHSRCCVEVTSGRGWGFSQCTRKNGHGPDGAYCKQHDPKAVAARQKATADAYNAKWNKERYQIHGRTFYNALKEIADGHNDARGLAQQVIAEFHAGERK